MLRIISGDARGVKLEVPEGIEVRPTQDRIKGAMFSALGSLDGAKVLDLCSGSGNLGLEALSRGAEEVVMIEQVREFCEFIKRNLTTVEKSIICSKNREKEDFSATVINSDALNAPRLLSNKKGLFDVIFADPPYIPKQNQKGPLDVLTDKELANFVSEEAILVLESGPEIFVDLPKELPWELIKRKNYGTTTVVTFWRLAEV